MKVQTKKIEPSPIFHIFCHGLQTQKISEKTEYKDSNKKMKKIELSPIFIRPDPKV